MKVALREQRELAAFITTKLETQKIAIYDANHKKHQIELLTSALRLLTNIRVALAEGNAVQVLPVHIELTTQETANILNVSRSHMVKLFRRRKASTS